jgi:hypothetical protein
MLQTQNSCGIIMITTGGVIDMFSAHFMKTLQTILLILLSFDLFGQIDSRTDWSKSIQKEFELIKGQDIDTFLIYYSYLGPWTNLPDSCKGIPSVWILWEKDKNFSARQLFCDSINKDSRQITDKSFTYFLNHRKDFKLKDEYFKKTKDLPPMQTDGLEEYLIFMTKKENIILNLSNYQRTDNKWNSLAWIKSMIGAIDLTKYE